jgi:ribonuclease HI
MPVSKPILDSICVQASCIGNPGDVEYRGVHTGTREVIFHKRPMSNGTKELAEFLAIVHALAHLNNQAKNLPIYSASETAILWVISKNLWTNLERYENSEEIFNLIERALTWLKNKNYTNAVLKWDTSAWGKIPANFGGEHPLINPCLQTVQQRQTIESSVKLTGSRSI